MIKMITVNVKLNEVSAINDFVNKVSRLSCDVDLVRGRYVIDAKSIMGIFSLDLSKPINLVIHDEETEEVKRFLGEIKDRVVG